MCAITEKGAGIMFTQIRSGKVFIFVVYGGWGLRSVCLKFERGGGNYAIFIEAAPWIRSPVVCYVLFHMLLCKRRVSRPRATDMNTKWPPGNRQPPLLPDLHGDLRNWPTALPCFLYIRGTARIIRSLYGNLRKLALDC